MPKTLDRSGKWIAHVVKVKTGYEIQLRRRFDHFDAAPGPAPDPLAGEESPDPYEGELEARGVKTELL